jgi:hypothetical protein
MMIIKTFFICAAAIAALSGCMTPGASGNAPSEVPVSRIFIKEMTAPEAGPNQVIFIRDPGMRGGNNLLQVGVNYVALADLQPGETISAWLPDGAFTFTVKPNPNPENLTRLGAIDLTLSGGKKHIVRVGGNVYGTTIEEIGAR